MISLTNSDLITLPINLMSRVFDWLFQPPNQPPNSDNTNRDDTMNHRSIFGEIDRVMQEMMQEHFQNMNIFLTPNQLENRTDEESNIRDRMLRKPEREHNAVPKRENMFVPRNDIDLDNAVQNNPKLIDQFLDDQPSNQIQQQEFNPFPQLFGSHSNQTSPNNFTFSSQTVVVRRGEDGKLKYEKREVRQDSQGNREEIVTSSDDTDSVKQPFLQNNTNQHQTRSYSVPVGEEGVFEKVKNWFFPPND